MRWKYTNRIGLINGIGDCFSEMGYYHHYAGDYELALSNSQKAISIFRKLNNPPRIAWSLQTIYKSLLRLNRIAEAEEAYRDGIENWRKAHYLWGEIIFRIEAGVYQLRQKNIEKALEFYDGIAAQYDVIPYYGCGQHYLARFRKRLIDNGVDENRLPIPPEYLTAELGLSYLFDW